MTLARADYWELARKPGVLTERQLRVLELKEINRFSWRQIAAMVNIDVSTVRGHYNAAVRRLYDEAAQQHPPDSTAPVEPAKLDGDGVAAAASVPRVGADPPRTRPQARARGEGSGRRVGATDDGDRS